MISHNSPNSVSKRGWQCRTSLYYYQYSLPNLLVSYCSCLLEQIRKMSMVVHNQGAIGAGCLMHRVKQHKRWQSAFCTCFQQILYIRVFANDKWRKICWILLPKNWTLTRVVWHNTCISNDWVVIFYMYFNFKMLYISTIESILPG